jgi:ABC-type dipeptide/oligopeptide/nickel transport system permease subunit
VDTVVVVAAAAVASGRAAGTETGINILLLYGLKKMARSHHRKKHKEHLRQYQKSRESYTTGVKAKGTNIFAIAGAVIGLAIAYFAAQGNLVWIIVGVLAGGAAGYFIGKKIDTAAEK